MLTGKKRYWLFQLLGWGAFFLMHIFFAWSYGKFSTPADRQLILVRASGFVAIGIIMTHLIRLAALKIGIFNKPLVRQLSSLVLITICASILGAVAEFLSYRYLDLFTKGEQTVAAKSVFISIISNIAGWLPYFLIWSAIYFIYHYVSYEQQQKVDTLKLRNLVKDLELKTIKSHINPHFIFNALNGIRALIDENPERARDAITELSNLLRSSINIHKNETVSMEDELDIVRDYLALEQMRFEDRLKVEYAIDEKTLDKKIPPMMLQTLVENAIKHGISHQVMGGKVKISSILHDGIMDILVENTGTLQQPLNEKGFGVKSTNERLQLLYGNNCSFNLYAHSPNVVAAKITIPITN